MLGCAAPTQRSAPVERRDEHDLVSVFELVVEFTLELPVGRVDQDEDSRSTVDALRVSDSSARGVV